MNMKTVFKMMILMAALISTALSHAGEMVERSEARLMLAGNTLEGKIIKPSSSYKMYFHPSGKLVRLTGKSDTEKGKWRLSDKNELCLEFASQTCGRLMKRDENTFDLLDQNNALVLTIDKVILGNPDKLKP